MISQLTFKKRLFFRFFFSKRRHLWGYFFQLERTIAEESMPKSELQDKNIRNLKTVLTREALLKNLPKNKVVAEIGVDHGEFSELIIKTNSPQKLHLIDSWAEDTRYHSGLKSIVENRFKNEIDKDMINLNVGLSTTVLRDFPDAYFDWVYLDTDHSFQTTKAELAILKSKVKPGGIIAGHDYTIGNWVGGYRYGVIEAVNEFCVNENWEIIFLTVESDHHRSFAIKEILL
jgi:hypothetical protein